MSAADDAVRILVQTALRIARPTPSYRLALAMARPHLHPELVRPDLRERVVAEVEEVAAAAPAPVGAKDLERALKEAWGEKPSHVLDDLDPEPAAVTPGSQVHRASLDGRDVAVKLLRPRLAEQLRADLSLAEALVAPARAVFRRGDPAALLREVRERVLEEVDLEHEAQTMRTWHRALRGHDRYRVPEPVTRLAAPRVLVSEWIDGEPVGAADAADVVGFFAGGAQRGLVHADPDPADVRRDPDGRLVVHDFGATRRIDPARTQRAAAALEAFVSDDPDRVARELAELGWLPEPDDARTAHAIGRDVFAPLLDGPARLDVPLLAKLNRDGEAHTETLLDIAARATPPPEDLWPLRGIGQLALLLARLGATEDWVPLALRSLREGW